MRRALRTLFSGDRRAACRRARCMAQATAQISGTVKDTSGGVLPGVSVTVTQTETGFKRKAISETDGLLSCPAFRSGRIASKRAAGVPHLDSDRHRAAGQQQPACRSPSSSARSGNDHGHGQHAAVETRTLGVGQVMENKRILELPLNGRNPADLLALLPSRPATAAECDQPQHGGQQRRPGVFGGRGSVVRRLLHPRRRHPQQSVRQPEPAAAVPRCAAGIPRGNERADGAERDALGRRRQRSDQVGHELVPRQRLRILPPSQLQLPRSVRRRRTPMAASKTTA